MTAPSSSASEAVAENLPSEMRALIALGPYQGVAAERIMHCMKAASSEIERLRAENERLAERSATLEALTNTPLWSHRALTARLHEIIATRFGVRFMDPPDGGDVSTPEQVEMMADALLAAEARAASAEAERDEARHERALAELARDALVKELADEREARFQAEGETEALAAKLAVMDAALEPFANCIFNDNGDITVTYRPFTSNELIAAYFTRRAREARTCPHGESDG